MSVLPILVARTLLGVLVAMLWVIGPVVHGHAPVTTESAVGLAAHAADTDHGDGDGDAEAFHGMSEGHEHLSSSTAAVDLPVPPAVALPAATTVAVTSDISATAVDRGPRAPPNPTPTLLHDLLRI